MFADAMDELSIKLAIEKEMELRRDSEVDRDADPSLYSPWGIMGPMDYPAKRFTTEKLD